MWNINSITTLAILAAASTQIHLSNASHNHHHRPGGEAASRAYKEQRETKELRLTLAAERFERNMNKNGSGRHNGNRATREHYGNEDRVDGYKKHRDDERRGLNSKGGKTSGGGHTKGGKTSGGGGGYSKGGKTSDGGGWRPSPVASGWWTTDGSKSSKAGDNSGKSGKTEVVQESWGHFHHTQEYWSASSSSGSKSGKGLGNSKSDKGSGDKSGKAKSAHDEGDDWWSPSAESHHEDDDWWSASSSHGVTTTAAPPTTTTEAPHTTIVGDWHHFHHTDDVNDDWWSSSSESHDADDLWSGSGSWSDSGSGKSGKAKSAKHHGSKIAKHGSKSAKHGSSKGGKSKGGKGTHDVEGWWSGSGEGGDDWWSASSSEEDDGWWGSSEGDDDWWSSSSSEDVDSHVPLPPPVVDESAMPSPAPTPCGKAGKECPPTADVTSTGIPSMPYGAMPTDPTGGVINVHPPVAATPSPSMAPTPCGKAGKDDGCGIVVETMPPSISSDIVVTAVPPKTSTTSPIVPEGNTIADIAVANSSTSTLVAALQAANEDVMNSLSGPGPFTVFAPTNDAFDALPEGELAALLADPDRLTNILLYHVVGGQVEAKDIPELLDAETLNGQSVRLRSGDDGVTVDDANVVVADIFASNGVIHVIDEVLFPEGALDAEEVTTIEPPPIYSIPIPGEDEEPSPVTDDDIVSVLPATTASPPAITFPPVPVPIGVIPDKLMPFTIAPASVAPTTAKPAEPTYAPTNPFPSYNPTAEPTSTIESLEKRGTWFQSGKAYEVEMSQYKARARVNGVDTSGGSVRGEDGSDGVIDSSNSSGRLLWDYAFVTMVGGVIASYLVMAR